MVPNKLTVRLTGLSLADRVRDYGRDDDREQPRLAILIHGFETSEAKAHEAYERFQAALESFAPGAVRRLGPIWEFHWPGDHPDKKVSKVTYAVRVPVAQGAGGLLAKWIAELRDDQEVVLVAHSLGCRVALEAVRKLRELRGGRPGPNVPAVFLLAAAVPVDLCAPARRFCGPLPRPDDRKRDGVEYVLHSRRDWVLKWPFNHGQALVGEPGNAVGRRGRPGNRWTRDWRTRHWHGQYWGSPIVAEAVCKHLRLGGPRLLREQSPAEEDALIAPPGPRERHLLVRRLPRAA
jgi:predicted alpha/beta hydrolase family esterase